MIYNIVEQNVNWALPKGIKYLLTAGKPQPTRGGPCLVAPVPVCTTYTQPWQRVLFSNVRDANPFFHFMESLWMLAGRNDVAWPAKFASNMKNFTDDGTTFWGAYGHRWINWFDYNQLHEVVAELKRDMSTRRVVLAMWDGHKDLQQGKVGKDVPCNTHAYFSIRDGKLDMLVSCRSNDIIWGCYGANAVHFSFLHEYIAALVGVPMGHYRQLSYNFHAYLEKYSETQLLGIANDSQQSNLYSGGVHRLVSLDGIEEAKFSAQLMAFMIYPNGPGHADDYTLLSQVARPMYAAFVKRKEEPEEAIKLAMTIAADDWRIACVEWLRRRKYGKS